jgi:hypothetical protein
MNLDQFKGHTPGPWDYYGDVCLVGAEAGQRHEEYCASIAPFGDFRGDIGHIQSSNVIKGIDSREGEANTRLIAAAPEILDYARKLEAENKRLIADRQGLADALFTITDRAEELRAENKRLLETLEEIISCAENVLITYADTNQLIIDMARKAQKGAGDD